MALTPAIDDNERSNFYALLALSFFLLGLCALFAGLTLATCSLDITWLEITSITARSKRRAQARAILNIRRHHSWMLCSLVICSVACGEAFPITMKEMLINKPPWLIVLVSTLFIAIFGEILPQTIIPRKALAWAYRFRPVIWFCMALTIFLSYPISWLIDRLNGNFEEHAVFSNSALAILISFHTKRGGRGGKLRESTAKIMIGALELDHCRIGGEFTRIPYTNDEEMAIETDLEKAEGLNTQAIYTRWSSVHTVNINDRVDSTFLKKVTSWNYSRIPVIGDCRSESDNLDMSSSSWAGNKIFGFLHVKNLIGIDMKDKPDRQTGLLVKDLSIYPLPIVRDDMEVIKLLSLFQLGMARMAIVVHAEENVAYEEYWETDFLEAALRSTKPLPQRERIFGIRSPPPIGLITYDDIISRLLQKRSYDEKDFFDRGLNNMVSTKLQAMAAQVHPSDAEYKRKDSGSPGTPSYGEDAHSPRRRHHLHVAHSGPKEMCKDERNTDAGNSRPVGLLSAEHAQSSLLPSQRHSSVKDDGIDMSQEREEREVGGLDGTREGAIVKLRRGNEESSYTMNSQGGFHGSNSSGKSIGNHLFFSTEDLAELGEYPTPFPRDRGQSSLGLRMASMPSRQPISIVPQIGKAQRRSTSGMLSPKLPNFRRVTPFSRYTYSSYERQNVNEPKNFDLKLPFAPLVIPELPGELPPPKYTLRNDEFEVRNMTQQDKSEGDATRDSGEILSVTSWDFSDFEDGSAHMGDHGVIASSSTYELAVVVREPENADHYDPQIVPHRHVSINSGNSGSCVPQREKSFHDDRALLPSQRRRLPRSAEIGGARSISLWF